MRVRIVWFSSEMGGRDSGPPPGPEYRTTGLFLQPKSPAAGPPESSIYASIIMTFVVHTPEETVAEFWFIAPDLLADYVYEGSTFLVMEGRRPVGYARMFEDNPD
jgi:hypothetical protein